MTTRQPTNALPESGWDDGREPPMLRLAEHAIGLWQAAQQVGDATLLDALRPLVIHVARALARDLMESTEDETAH
jgi:hypothetical protein